MKFYIARDKDGQTFVFDNMPARDYIMGCWLEAGENVIKIDPKHPICRELTWEKEPVEVVIVKKQTMGGFGKLLDDQNNFMPELIIKGETKE